MAHVLDISAAFAAALEAPTELVKNQVFNIGTNDNNYTVKEMAKAAQRAVPGCKLTFTGEHTDPRSYRVSASKILTVLKDYYHPQWNIQKGGEQLMAFYKELGFDKEVFESYKVTRLKCLKKRIADGVIDQDLRRIG